MLIRDARGREFQAPKGAQRIVSLVPSFTEAVFALGAGERVVGVTDYCIHPSAPVNARTRIGGTKNPRVSDILALEPDLVIANIEENRKPDVEALEAHGVPVFVTFAQTVRDAIDELRVLAQLVGSTGAERILGPIEQEYARQRARQSSAPPRRVFVPVWRDPWMTANAETYIGNLVETCGGKNIFAGRARQFPLAADLGKAEARSVPGADTRYPRVSLDEVAEREPEVILLPDEPYRFTEQDAKELQSARGLEHTHIHLVDGTLVTWYGVRMARAMQTISGLITSA